MYLTGVLQVLLFAVTIGEGVLAVTITSEPLVTIGDEATVTCWFAGMFSYIRWSRSSTDVIDVTNTNAILEYRIHSIVYAAGVDSNHYNFEVSSGRYILTVKSVTLNDGGKYWCEIVELPPNPYTDDVAFTAFEIRVPPSSITVTYDYVQYNDGVVFSVVTGNDRHFTCSTPGVKPAATFSFKVLNVNTTEELQGTVLNSSNVQDNRLVDSSFFTTVDVTDIPATLQLSCDANNKPDGLNEAGIGAIVTIEVKVPPKTSQIAISDADGQDLVDGTAIVEQGRGHMFTCVVQGSRPAAEVRWFLGGVPQLLEVESSVDRNASNDLYDTSSNWTFIPTRNQHGLEVRCEASTADSVDPLPHTVIKLDVYGPPGFPTITGDKNMVEDMTTTLTCTADGGYPDDWNLVWYNRNAAFNMSTTTVSNSTNGRFMFTSVLLLTPNRADNEMNITCFAKRGSWSGDESSVWGPVNVRFCTSNVRVTDCPFVAVAGLDLTLSCVSETSNPPTTLVWLTDNDSNLTSPSNQSNYSVGGYGGTVTSQTYTTGILSVSNSGDVLQCCATNSALDYCSQNVCDSCALNVQLPAALTVTSEPWVTIRTDTTLACFGTEIDSRTLNSLTWLWSQVNNSDVHSATQLVKYTRGNLEFADGIDSNHYEFQTSNGIFTLTIKSVSLEDDGKYWCDIIESPPNPATEDTAYGVLRTRVPPTWVEITYDGVTYSALDTVSVVAGTNHMFSCWVPGVKPEANITLTLSEGNKTKQLLGNQTYRPNSDDSRLMDSCNTVYMSIAQSPAKSQLTCSATNTQDGSTNPDVYVIVKLSIKVPPGFPMLYDITGPLNTGTTVLVNQGETFNFTCEVLGTRPAASLDWYLNGVRQLATNQTTTLDDATELFDTMGVWTFIPGRADHKQEVKCEGTTAESQVPFPAAVVTLDVYGPPDSPTITGNTRLIEGVNTLLTCSADMGYPNDWILVWYTGDILQNNTITVATSSSDRYKFQSTLDFTPERDLNGKSIKCSAKRGSLTTGPDGGIGPVAVQFCAWTVSIVKYPLAVLEGSAALLTCTSESSNPAATLIWSKDGITLPTFIDHVVTDGEYGGKVTSLTINIEALTRQNNGEVLQCCINSYELACPDTVCANYTLNVLYVPMFILPVMPSSQTVNEGDNMTLTCIADANPKPNGFIIWEKFKDGKWTQVDVEDGETADGCSNLNLNVIARHQAGRYRCKADNGLHQDEYRKYSSSMTVIVYYEARISMKTPNHLVIKNGTDAMMSCTASGNPAPTIEWFSPSNASITNGTDLKKFLLESSTSAGNQLGGFEVSSVLTIKALIHQFDYGTYTCTTSNGVGQDDSLKLTITDTRIPDKPTNVEVVGRTSSSLVIRWRPAYDGGEDQTFLITHIKTSESPFLEVYSGQVDGDRSSFTIVGLESSTEYEIRVYGENSVGRNEDYGHTTGNTLKLIVTEIPSTEKSSNVNIGGIAGGAILCFGILVLLFVLEIFLRRRTLKKRAEEKLEAAKKSLNCGYEIPRKTLEETSYNIIEETKFSHSNKEQESSINSDTSEWEDDFQLDDQSTGSKDDDNLPPKQNHSDGPSVYQDISEFRKLPSNGPELALPTLRESCLEQNIYQSISERETPQYGNVAHPDKAFPRGNLKIIKELGRGTFSRVLLADADGIVDGAKVTLVAVKTVHGEATDADKAAMLKELNVMKTLPDHPNIIQLLGYCTDQDPPYIILEFLAKGNLKDFLHYSRSQCGLMYGNLRGLSKSLSPKHFLKFAKDVADGMEFIASQQCIHRDLAARNVLVADDLTCKVADFGLARDIMNTRLYERRSACQLPLRWMALETIIDDVYTTESDVWSFGVLLWEIVTFGARPYPNMHHTTMIAELQKGYRMPKPLHCTTKLYRMMLKCWRMGPERRPTFTQISDKLKKLLRERKECISMRDFVEHIYEVTVPHGDHEKV